MRRDLAVLVLISSLALVSGSSWVATAEEVPRLSKDGLKEMLGNPEVIIIDVRTASAWNRSELKIKGAVREDPANVNSWINKYPKDKTLVFY